MATDIRYTRRRCTNLRIFYPDDTMRIVNNRDEVVRSGNWDGNLVTHYPNTDMFSYYGRPTTPIKPWCGNGGRDPVVSMVLREMIDATR